MHECEDTNEKGFDGSISIALRNDAPSECVWGLGLGLAVVYCSVVGVAWHLNCVHCDGSTVFKVGFIIITVKWMHTESELEKLFWLQWEWRIYLSEHLWTWS